MSVLQIRAFFPTLLGFEPGMLHEEEGGEPTNLVDLSIGPIADHLHQLEDPSGVLYTTHKYTVKPYWVSF